MEQNGALTFEVAEWCWKTRHAVGDALYVRLILFAYNSVNCEWEQVGSLTEKSFVYHY